METRNALAAILSLSLLGLSATAAADTGFYVGASAGGATLESDFDTSDFPELPAGIDEDDTAFKVFGGFKLDLPFVLDLGVEAGYVNFGEPEIQIDTTLGPQEIGIETTGFNVFGTAGFDLGPIDVFGKFGFVSYEIEAAAAGFGSATDDGTDPAYGIGASFGLGSLEVRGEYEIYDFDDADIEMLSIGLVYRF